MRQTPGTAAPGLERAATTGPQDFAELSRRVREAGLMTRRPWLLRDQDRGHGGGSRRSGRHRHRRRQQLVEPAVAVGLAFVLAQLGFIGHDAGHRQVSSPPPGNDLIGLVLTNLLTGVSFGWWLTKHSRHHAHTNQPGRIPTSPPALSSTPGSRCAPAVAWVDGWVKSRSPIWCRSCFSRPTTCTWPA